MKLPLLSSLLCSCLLLSPLTAEESQPAEAAPERVTFKVSIGDALQIAQAHMEENRPDDERMIFGIQLLAVHGTFWLVDLEPYPPSKPLPENPVTSLLINMEGEVRERGVRRTTVEEREEINRRAARIREGRMQRLRDEQGQQEEMAVEEEPEMAEE